MDGVGLAEVELSSLRYEMGGKSIERKAEARRTSSGRWTRLAARAGRGVHAITGVRSAPLAAAVRDRSDPTRRAQPLRGEHAYRVDVRAAGQQMTKPAPLVYWNWLDMGLATEDPHGRR